MNLIINYSSKWWYKLITVILVFALILYFSIGIAHKANAVVVSTVIVGTVLAALAAAGIGFAVSDMTAQQMTQWVSDKLNDWTTDIGGSIQDHIDNSLISVTANGIIAIGTAAAQGISDFISWLQNEDTLTDNTTTPILTGGTNVIKINDDNYHAIMKVWGDCYSIKRTSQSDLYVVAYHDSNDSGPLVFSTNIREQYYLCRHGNDEYVEPDYTGYDTIGTCLSSNAGNPTLYYATEWWIHWGQVTESNVDIYSSISSAAAAVREAISTGVFTEPSLSYETNVIAVPSIGAGDKWFLDVGAEDGEDIGTVTEGVITDTITNTLDVTDEIVESNTQEVVIVNEDAIAVNVDHHMIGFTNLPDFAHLNLNSIWHYVSDAVDFASSWLAWFVSFLTAMPLLAIPLYMSFTLLVVLSFLRRFI